MAGNNKKLSFPKSPTTKNGKKAIPGSDNAQKVVDPTSTDFVSHQSISATGTPLKEDKERFTLWLSQEIYRAFKIHTAIRKGSASDYVEALIRKDLNI